MNNETRARQRELKKVGEVAEMFGTTPRTLLYYEEQGIISPRRTPGGTRLYSESDINRFEVAYRMSCLGIPLKTIVDLALTRPAAKSGAESARKLSAIIDGLKINLERQIRHLENLHQDLDRGQTLVRQCSDCPNKPSRTTCPQCPCEIYMDRAQVLSLTWDPDRGDTDHGNNGATEEKPRIPDPEPLPPKRRGRRRLR